LTGVTRIDVLKMLLYAPSSTSSQARSNGIAGKTRLQKEVFLVQKALAREDKRIPRMYNFMPYHYGPFSRQLYFDINLLRSQGLVEEKIRSHWNGVFRGYRLTGKGIRQVEVMVQDPQYKRIFDLVRDVKQKHDSMPLMDLVELTHREYPEYVGNMGRG
jgi:uncharacterized protein YwgA